MTEDCKTTERIHMSQEMSAHIRKTNLDNWRMLKTADITWMSTANWTLAHCAISLIGPTAQVENVLLLLLLGLMFCRNILYAFRLLQIIRKR